jgi:glycosyltransferase involved in cell wall biosynthesis
MDLARFDASSSFMTGKLVMISINASWNIINFRKGLISGLQASGYRVVVLAPEDEYSAQLENLGVTYASIVMDKQGVSPARDLLLLINYIRMLRKLRPDIFLGYTAKPNIYGSLAARMLGIPVINNIAGLGTAFIEQGWLTKVVTGLYRMALRRASTVFFQNPEDLALFVSGRLVRFESARLLPGSGLDLKFFQPEQSTRVDGEVRFLLIARLLWDKGVGEYVEAAEMLRRVHPHARFQILGFAGAANRTAVPASEIERWQAEGFVEYLGHADDVRPFISASDCVVLPSYREGLPRVLLEAGAMAKPMIATDVPGCRQVVTDGENGFLCVARDAGSLALAMSKVLGLSRVEREAMGSLARHRVEANFDEKIVVEHYLDAISAALGPNISSSSPS